MSRTYEPHILGVLNVSPESMVRESVVTDGPEIVKRARELAQAGATWIDVGGRSITPDVPMIPDAEEQRRLLSTLPLLADCLADPKVPISVDTWSEETALVSLEAGAQAINFTGASLGPRLLDEIAARSAQLFLTFMPYGDAYQMRDADPMPVGIDAILEHLAPRVDAAKKAGIGEVVVDPNVGIIHASTDDLTKIHRQLEILWNLDSLRTLGCPILLYAARKPERLARLMMASAVVHARPDYIRTHTPEMIEQLLHVDD